MRVAALQCGALLDGRTHAPLYDMLLPQASFTNVRMLNTAVRLITSSFPSLLTILGHLLQLLHYLVSAITPSTFTVLLAKWMSLNQHVDLVNKTTPYFPLEVFIPLEF